MIRHFSYDRKLYQIPRALPITGSYFSNRLSETSRSSATEISFRASLSDTVLIEANANSFIIKNFLKAKLMLLYHNRNNKEIAFPFRCSLHKSFSIIRFNKTSGLRTLSVESNRELSVGSPGTSLSDEAYAKTALSSCVRLSTSFSDICIDEYFC